MSKSKVKPLVAQYAISLRKEGKKYTDIVELCSQIDKSGSVTLDWCKRNLKSVEIETVDLVEQNCLDQITKLALLPKGVTYAECKKIIAYNHKIDLYSDSANTSIYSLYKKYKSKIQKVEGTFFRPSSIQPNRAQQSFKQLLSCANYLYDTIADYVNDYCVDNPEVYGDAVRRELANILFPELKLMGGGAIRCKHLEEAVETLKERVPQIPYNEDAQYYKPSFHIDESELPY
jgi:hypothetical protein